MDILEKASPLPVPHLDPFGRPIEKASGSSSATLSSATLLSVARLAGRRAVVGTKAPGDGLRFGLSEAEAVAAAEVRLKLCDEPAGSKTSRSLSVALLRWTPMEESGSRVRLNDDDDSGRAPAEARLPPREGGCSAPLNPAEERLRESPTASQSSCTPDRLSSSKRD